MYNRGQAGATTGINGPAPICAHAHTHRHESKHIWGARIPLLLDKTGCKTRISRATKKTTQRDNVPTGRGVKKLETITDLFFTFNCCVFFFLSSVRVSFFTIGTETTDNTDTTTDGNERTTRQETNEKGRGPAADYRGEQNQLQKNDRLTLTRRDVARN